MREQTRHIAYFISPHGFGHAARSCAIMSAMGHRDSSVVFDIYTTVPEWFFSQSLDVPYHYHSLESDIGLCQPDPTSIDIPATLVALNSFTPFKKERLTKLAAEIQHAYRVVADISPLGLSVAHEAGVPSVLVENFTWDWIYDGIVPYQKQFAAIIEYYQQCFALAKYHVKTEPLCQESDADLLCGPISRAPLLTREQLWALLELPEDARMVLVTMGGIPIKNTEFIERLTGLPDDIHVIFPGASAEARQLGQIHLLPRHNRCFHPDLVHAADWVIGKLGYSTVAEVHAAQVPLFYLTRDNFRESAVLERFVKKTIPSMHLTEAEFNRCAWLERLDEFGGSPMPKSAGLSTNQSAAEEVAAFILDPTLG